MCKHFCFKKLPYYHQYIACIQSGVVLKLLIFCQSELRCVLTKKSVPILKYKYFINNYFK